MMAGLRRVKFNYGIAKHIINTLKICYALASGELLMNLGISLVGVGDFRE